jgi:hypothetical protein
MVPAATGTVAAVPPDLTTVTTLAVPTATSTVTANTVALSGSYTAPGQAANASATAAYTVSYEGAELCVVCRRSGASNH